MQFQQAMAQAAANQLHQLHKKQQPPPSGPQQQPPQPPPSAGGPPQPQQQQPPPPLSLLTPASVSSAVTPTPGSKGLGRLSVPSSLGGERTQPTKAQLTMPTALQQASKARQAAAAAAAAAAVGNGPPFLPVEPRIINKRVCCSVVSD